MKIAVLLAGLMAAASPAAAFTFDNTSCKAFLAGTWDGGGEHEMNGQKVTVATHSVYSEDGTFTSSQTMEIPGQQPMARTISGTWDAKAGPTADTCEASTSTEEFGAMTVVLTVVDANTVRSAEGNVSTRVVE